MTKQVSTAVVWETLRRLGFAQYVGETGHPVFRHEKSDTFHIFPKDGRRTVDPMKLWSIRHITIGRGAATERAYDKAFAEASAAKPARPAKPKAAAKPARRRAAAGAAA